MPTSDRAALRQGASASVQAWKAEYSIANPFCRNMTGDASPHPELVHYLLRRVIG
jgi:hypothetical protein